MSPEPRLAHLLEQVHAELAASPQVGGSTSELLRTVLADIESLLASSPEASGSEAVGAEGPAGAEGTEDPSFAGQVDAALGRLENGHPKLTVALEELAAALARVGL